MTTLTDRFDDLTKPLGTVAGVFLVLAALGTLAGAPWTTEKAIAAAGVQVVGAVLMLALGAGLAYLSWDQ